MNELFLLEDIFSSVDVHLQKVEEKLADRAPLEAEDSDDGLRMTLNRDAFLDLTYWSEETYRVKSMNQKKKALEAHGFLVHDVTGKGAEALYQVTMTHHAWYYLLLRGEFRPSDAVHAYLDNLFMGNGYLELGGSFIAATLDEFAQKYATQFNETATAVKRKLDRIRVPLKKYHYLLNGRSSTVHQIRVRKYGHDTYLTGPHAVLMDYEIRREYALFYQKLHIKFNSLMERATTRKKRDGLQYLKNEEIKDFTKGLKYRRRATIIRKHYASCLSTFAEWDYRAIQVLLMKGATFSEIRQFLSERPAYYEWEKERERQLRELSMEEKLV